jgi:hypothetical protein
MTALLRSQPLERIDVPVVITRRRSRLAAVQSVTAVAAVAVAGVWLGVTMAGRRAESPATPVPAQANHAAAIGSSDRFDWQAGGPARGQRFVQFVPGGLHMSDP